MKVVRKDEIKEVIYGEGRWEILRRKRNEALKIMESLERCGFKCIVHGSVARGDVDEDSDVDVVIPYKVSPFLVEQCLIRHGFKIFGRAIVMATPQTTPKAEIYLDPDELKVVTIPLSDLKTTEYEFYRFSGYLETNQLREGVRVPGVNKRLMLIRPTERGHLEMSILGRESYVANLLGVSLEVVMERASMLTRRDEVGRTGIFLKYYLTIEESFEEAIRRLVKSNKFFRKFIS